MANIPMRVKAPRRPQAIPLSRITLQKPSSSRYWWLPLALILGTIAAAALVDQWPSMAVRICTTHEQTDEMAKCLKILLPH